MRRCALDAKLTGSSPAQAESGLRIDPKDVLCWLGNRAAGLLQELQVEKSQALHPVAQPAAQAADQPDAQQAMQPVGATRESAAKSSKH